MGIPGMVLWAVAGSFTASLIIATATRKLFRRGMTLEQYRR